MGVGRRLNRLDELCPIRVEDQEEFNYADYDLTESGDEVTINVEIRTSRSKKNKEKRTERKLKKMMEDLETDGVRVKSNMGMRKHRRIENLRLLLSNTDRDDIVTDFSDIVPRTVSAFERLLAEKENMRKWNEFIEKDEEEQRRILQTGVWEEEKDGVVLGGKSLTPRRKTGDEREHHPAYSARACFEQIDKKGRQLLASRDQPWAFVDFTEKQLREFFSADSDAVFISQLESSLHRGLLHAISQFLRLSSKSLNDSSGIRVTEVRNKRAYFIPPRQELLTYLSSIRQQPIIFTPWNPEEDEDSSTDDSFVKISP